MFVLSADRKLAIINTNNWEHQENETNEGELFVYWIRSVSRGSVNTCVREKNDNYILRDVTKQVFFTLLRRDRFLLLVITVVKLEKYNNFL